MDLAIAERLRLNYRLGAIRAHVGDFLIRGGVIFPVFSFFFF